MTHKDSQVLIFNRDRILSALASSIRSVAILTGVDDSEVKRYYEEMIVETGRYYYRIDNKPLIGKESLTVMTLPEYDGLGK